MHLSLARVRPDSPLEVVSGGIFAAHLCPRVGGSGQEPQNFCKWPQGFHQYCFFRQHNGRDLHQATRGNTLPFTLSSDTGSPTTALHITGKYNHIADSFSGLGGGRAESVRRILLGKVCSQVFPLLGCPHISVTLVFSTLENAKLSMFCMRTFHPQVLVVDVLLCFGDSLTFCGRDNRGPGPSSVASGSPSGASCETTYSLSERRLCPRPAHSESPLNCVEVVMSRLQSKGYSLCAIFLTASSRKKSRSSW